MPRRGGKRPLKPGEKALWQKVTDTVTPRPDALFPTTETPEPSSNKTSFRLPRRPALAASTPVNVSPSSATEKPPALEAGDPRMARRVARGRLAIDATLDLHGLRQDEARTRLGHFVDFAALRGDRVLLVITGKGRPSDDVEALFEDSPRGILRKRFLDWVEERPLRDRIASVRQAHQRHGGGGAFYIILKSRDERRL